MSISTTIRPLSYDDIYVGLLDYLKLVKLSDCNAINFNFKFLDKITGNIDGWEQYVQKLMGYCNGANISIPVCHAYYLNSFILDNSELKLVQKKKIEQCIKLSKLIGAKMLVVHAGICLNDEGEYDRERTIAENVNYFSTLCLLADECQVKIAIENNVVYNESPVGDVVEPSVDVLNKVCDIINEGLKKNVIGICYDIGHANLANRNIINDIQSYKDNLFAFHLHNNRGYDLKENVWKCDTHSSLLEGNIDVYSILRLLREINYEGELVVESVYIGNEQKIVEYINRDTMILNS